MDIGKTTYGIVALLVAVLVIGLVAVPVIDDATTGAKYTGKNTNYEDTYTYLESSPSFSWARSSSAQISLTIGGVTTPISYGSANEVFVATDDFALRAISSGAQLWDYGDSTYTLVSDPTVAISLTVSNGSYTLVFNGTTTTGSISWALVKDPNGDYGLYGQSFRATIGQEVLIGHLYTSEYGPFNLARATDGAVTGYAIEPYTYSGTAITASEVSYTLTYAEQGEGQAIGSYTGMTMAWGDSSTSDHFRAWAPIDYESTATEGGGGTNQILLSIIPILLIIVAIMVAVRLVSNG